MNKKYDYLVVGSGISGATIARLLSDAGKKVLVIEARGEVGGNIANYFDPNDPASIANTLKTSIDDKGKYDAEIDAWVSRFSWEESARKIREVAESL